MSEQVCFEATVLLREYLTNRPAVALADDLGVTHQAVSHWRNGLSKPRRQTQWKLYEITGNIHPISWTRRVGEPATDLDASEGEDRLIAQRAEIDRLLGDLRASRAAASNDCSAPTQDPVGQGDAVSAAGVTTPRCGSR